MFLHVTKANYLTDYKVEVTFNNGRKGYSRFIRCFEGSNV